MRLVKQVADDQFGSLEGMFLFYNWDGFGRSALANAVNHAKIEFGSVEEFVEAHQKRKPTLVQIQQFYCNSCDTNLPIKEKQQAGRCMACAVKVSMAHREKMVSQDPDYRKKEGARHREINAEKIAEQQRAFHDRNPEWNSERNKLYRAENPEKIREYRRLINKRDRSIQAARLRKWRRENPAKNKESTRRNYNPERNRQHREGNPDLYASYAAFRNARRYRAVLMLEGDQDTEIGMRMEWRTAGKTLDHIDPLKGDEYGICGLHTLSNFQGLEPSENSAKRNKFRAYSIDLKTGETVFQPYRKWKVIEQAKEGDTVMGELDDYEEWG
ncbi:MAG: hypothetical protein ABJQ53_02985 [Roseibium sp.]